jgi:hypothetical protein
MRSCVLSLLLICAAAEAQPREDTSVAAAVGPLAEVPFQTGSSRIPRDATTAISDAARWHAQHPARLLFVEGQADARGSHAANLRLSQERADAVRAALIRAGADPLRIVVVGYGEDVPAGDRTTQRRVIVRGSQDTYEELVQEQHDVDPDTDPADREQVPPPQPAAPPAAPPPPPASPQRQPQPQAQPQGAQPQSSWDWWWQAPPTSIRP